MALRVKMFLAGSVPAGLCVAFSYLAWVAGNTADGRWLFVLGAMSATVAITLSRATWLTYQYRSLEAQHAELARYVRTLEERLDGVSKVVDTRLAVKAWRQEGMRAAIRNGTSRLYAVGDDLEEHHG
jgi:hypothetical protein